MNVVISFFMLNICVSYVHKKTHVVPTHVFKHVSWFRDLAIVHSPASTDVQASLWCALRLLRAGQSGLHGVVLFLIF